MRRLASLVALAIVAALLPAGARPPVTDVAAEREVMAGEAGDFDVRDAQRRAPSLAAARAEAALAREVPGAAVKWNARMGTAKTIQVDGGFLSSPARITTEADAERIARAWIAEHRDLFGLGAASVAGLTVTRNAQLSGGGAWALVLRQQVGGLATFAGGSLGVNIAPHGRIASVWADTGPDGALPRAATLSAADALIAVAKREGAKAPSFPVRAALPGGDRLTIFEAAGGYARHNARLVAFPTAGGPRLAWRVFYAKAGDEMLSTAVDALTGVVLFRNNQVDHAEGDQGRVFRNHPKAPKGGTHEIVSFEGDKAASPAGWVGEAPTTAGNNVLAFTDWSWPKLGGNGFAPVLSLTQLNPVPDTMPVAPERSFDFEFTDAWANDCDVAVTTPAYDLENPSYAMDREASVTNIFYFGNKIHDVSYKYGFTEKFGNMQLDNFERGGRASDPVRFMAMAGILNNQIDNAFMFTPADGGEPQDLIDPADPAATAARATAFIPPFSGMFLWKPVPTFQAPCVDGDFDGSTAYHEYTHGISNRMTGGGDDADALSAHQSGSMGEAWSDWVAHMILEMEGVENRTADGIYITGNTLTGIRHFKLDQNPLTYGDIGFGRFGPEVHDDGEIWSGTLWDLRAAMIKKHGKARGLDRAMRLVFDGMAMQPRLPDMLDARDAILRANQVRYKGADAALIWNVFAKRGMGRSARSVDANDVNPRPGFDGIGGNGYLAGTIRDIGGAGMIAKVLVGLGEGKPTPVAVTPRSGSFRVPMTPGRYLISYAAAGYGLQKIGTATVAAGKTTTIRPLALNRNLASAGWGALVTGGLAAGDPGIALIDDHEFTGQIVDVGKPVTIMLGGRAPATVRGIAVSSKPSGGGTSQNATGYKVETSVDGRVWKVAQTGGVKTYKPRPIASHWTRVTKSLPGVKARYVRVTVTSALANTKAILGGIQVLGTAPGMAVAPIGGGKPFTDPAGAVALANAAGPDASVTFNEFALACMTPASQGLDAYIVELPDTAGDGVHNFATKGGQELARDLDAYFYGAHCAPTGAIASGSADEAGPIPPGSKWAVIVLFAGTTDGFSVTVTSTLERVIPPPGTPTRTPSLPRSAGRIVEQTYLGTPGDAYSTSCANQVADVPQPYPGGGCFVMEPGDRSVKVSVSDDQAGKVSGYWVFGDANGDPIGELKEFCVTFATPVPKGAVDLSVWVDQAFSLLSGCGSEPATSGTIKAVFS